MSLTKGVAHQARYSSRRRPVSVTRRCPYPYPYPICMRSSLLVIANGAMTVWPAGVCGTAWNATPASASVRQQPHHCAAETLPIPWCAWTAST